MSDAETIREAADTVANARATLQDVDREDSGESPREAAGVLASMTETLREIAVNAEVAEEVTDERD